MTAVACLLFWASYSGSAMSTCTCVGSPAFQSGSCVEGAANAVVSRRNQAMNTVMETTLARYWHRNILDIMRPWVSLTVFAMSIPSRVEREMQWAVSGDGWSV
jgi:hypothetical protein